LRLPVIFLFCALILPACSQQKPAVSESMRQVDPHLPVDFSGSWQRNYARDDEVGRVLQQAYYELARTAPDRYNSPAGMAAPSQRDADAIVSLARLAELITRFDLMTIVQNDQEIRIQRKDDFSLVCRFNQGSAETVTNAAGGEICGWDGKDLVSQLSLADGLQIINRYTISEDGQQLRAVTTVSSSVSRVPFTLRRFYNKYDRPASEFHCIETLSMKRVCSTREIEE
jgi:hypothetical protein